MTTTHITASIARWLVGGLAFTALTVGATPTIAATSASPLPDPEVGLRLPAVETTTSAPWWHLLGDSILAGLIDQGLAQNIDLLRAGERVQQSRAIARASRLELLPGGEIGLSRPMALAAELNRSPSASSRRAVSVQAGADLSWEIDIFGRLGKAAQANAKRTAAVEAEHEGIRLLVAAEIAHAWLSLDGAREQIALLEDVIANRRTTLRLVTHRARVGFSAGLDEARAAADVASAEAALPAQRAAAAVASHRLAVLLGVSPIEYIPPPSRRIEPFTAQLQLPRDVDWTRQRPDLRAAEQLLDAAALDVSAAQRAFLPRLRLNGTLGWLAGTSDGLGANGSTTWLAVPSLVLPVFDLPRLDAALELAKAQQREAVLTYRQQVLLAAEEVQNAVARLSEVAQQVRAQSDAKTHASKAEQLARKRFEAGAADLLELLDAQRTAYQAETGLAAVRVLHRQYVIELFRATGTLHWSAT